MKVWCVASTSPVKLEAVRSALPECAVVGVKADSDVPAQPVQEHSGRLGAENRLRDAKRRWVLPHPPVGLIAIESYVEGVDDSTMRDCAIVLVEFADGTRREAISRSTEFPASLFKAAWLATPSEERDDLGCSVTVGDVIHKSNPEIPSDDWHQDPQFGGVPRAVKIRDALLSLLVTDDTTV